MTSPRYQHSGHPGNIIPYAAAIGLPALVAVTGAAGAIYALIHGVGIGTTFVSLIWVGATGYGLGKLCRWARCRNAAIATVVGLVLGCFAVYCEWAWFEAFLLRTDPTEGSNVLSRFVTLFTHPARLWEHAGAIADTGFVSYSKHGTRTTHQGAELWVAWAVDALWTVTGLTFFIRGGDLEEVYCENCNAWATPWDQIDLLPADPALRKQVEQGDFNALLALEPDPSKAALPRLQLTIHRCNNCGLMHVWRLTEITPDSKQPTKPTAPTATSPFYLLSMDDLAQVQGRFASSR